jgi:hypothetical protein
MDFFAKFESVSKSLSLIMVPVVIAVAGYVVNGSLERQKMDLERDKLNQEMIKKAADVIFLAKDSEQMFGPDASLELRRLYRLIGSKSIMHSLVSGFQTISSRWSRIGMLTRSTGRGQN